jgi:hypothetical protein
MKRLAPLACAALLSLPAWDSRAQIPIIQVYFSGNPVLNTYVDTHEFCKPPGTQQDLYVVLRNWNMWVSAVEFSIDYPPALFVAYDASPPNTLTIGRSVAEGGFGGIAIAWQYPQSGSTALLALTVQVFWTSSCDCYGTPQPVWVRGYQYANIGNGGHANPRAVRWPDFAEIDGVGMMSLVCPDPPATAQTTWGRVKALYR